MHTFTTEALGGKKMAGYAAWFIGIGALTRIIFPATLGTIIRSVGFGIGASIATGLAVILLLFTLVLRDQRKNAGQGFSMRRFFKHIKENKLAKPLWLQFGVQMFYGVLGAATLCVTILVVLTFENDLILGVLTSIFCGVSVVVLTIYKAIKSQRGKSWTYYIFSAIPLLMAIGLLFGLSPVTVILCQAGYLSFKTATQSEFERARMNIMSDFNSEHLHTEGLMFIEVAYTIARYVGLGLVVTIYLAGAFYMLQVLLVGLMALFLTGAILLRLWTKKFLNIKADKVFEGLPTDN